MGGYFNRGASTGGHDEGYHNRDNITGPEGVGSATGGPGGVIKHYIGVEEDLENPNIVRAVPDMPEKQDRELDETAGVTTQDTEGSSYPDIIEGSDSKRTGTSWGLPGVEDAATVSTPQGEMAEGTEEGEAHPNRNTGKRLTHDELDNVGSWSTIENTGTPGSPTGNS